MSVLREKSGDTPPKIYAQITIDTESRYRQAVMMGLLEELLRSYPDEIPRFVVSSDSRTAAQFETEYAKP